MWAEHHKTPSTTISQNTTNLHGHKYDVFIISSPPSATYMRRWTGSLSVQVMACRLTSAGLLLIALLGTNFSVIWIGILPFSFKKIHLKMSSAEMAALLSRGGGGGGGWVIPPLPFVVYCLGWQTVPGQKQRHLDCLRIDHPMILWPYMEDGTFITVTAHERHFVSNHRQLDTLFKDDINDALDWSFMRGTH